MKKIYLILNSLRSSFNVGSIFRTADACKIEKIYLCGITPVPGKDLQGNRRVAKTAIGAENYVAWEYVKNVRIVVEKLKKKGVFICSLEQTKSSINYLKEKYCFPLALVVGNELMGIDKEILNLSDSIVELPMLGKKNSLNVSCSMAIMLYYLRSIK